MTAAQTRITSYHHRVRYFEIDQQGVVFNMWYLGYFDEAMSLFLAEGGLAYRHMIEMGYDVQLVHSEIDWVSSLGPDEDARVDVTTAGVGRTSFTLRFEVFSGDQPVATGQTVYVVVATDGSGKRAIPPFLRQALGEVG